MNYRRYRLKARRMVEQSIDFTFLAGDMQDAKDKADRVLMSLDPKWQQTLGWKNKHVADDSVVFTISR